MTNVGLVATNGGIPIRPDGCPIGDLDNGDNGPAVVETHHLSHALGGVAMTNGGIPNVVALDIVHVHVLFIHRTNTVGNTITNGGTPNGETGLNEKAHIGITVTMGGKPPNRDFVRNDVKGDVYNYSPAIEGKTGA